MKVLFVGFISVLLSAAAGTVAGDSKTLRVGFSEDAVTLDPANHRRRETETVIRNMYDGLLTRSMRMNVIPELAQNWRQIDEITYEFALRQGVRFHNGDMLTADDIKFTFERLSREGGMEGETSPRKTLLPEIESISVLDDFTVRFNLLSPWPQLPAMLPLQEVVSRRFVESNRAAGLDEIANGTGPFRLVEWTKGERIVMRRFEDYYGGAPQMPPVGPACVEQLEFQIIPDAGKRVASLLKGDVNIIDKLPASAVDEVDAHAGTKVMQVPGTRTYFVALNMNRPPLNELAVRRAMNHAIDRDRLIEHFFVGGARTVNGVLSPYAFGYNPDLPAYEYDPRKSRRLLEAAGFRQSRPMVFHADQNFQSLAFAMAEMLAEVGIEIDVVIDTSQAIRERWLSGKETGDMWLTSWGNGSLDPVGIFNPTLRSGGRGNFNGYANREVDALLHQAMIETSQTKRARLFQSAEKLVNRDAPWLFLWVPEALYGVSTDLRGWRPSSDGRINLHDACVD